MVLRQTVNGLFDDVPHAVTPVGASLFQGILKMESYTSHEMNRHLLGALEASNVNIVLTEQFCKENCPT